MSLQLHLSRPNGFIATHEYSPVSTPSAGFCMTILQTSPLIEML